MPPIADKPITDSAFFSGLWRQAKRNLERCQNLYLCGYSLPQADYLAQALFMNFENQNLETITIVDPNPQIITHWMTLLHRDGIADGNKKPFWRYYRDFNEFATLNNPHKLGSYSKMEDFISNFHNILRGEV